MDRRTLGATLCIAFLGSRLLDLVVTYRFSPGLDREANPLVSWLGAGWGELLVLQFLMSLAVVACTVRWAAGPLDGPVADQGDDVWSYSSRNWFGVALPRSVFVLRLSYSVPRPLTRFFHLAGFVAPSLIAVMSLLSIAHWYLLLDGAVPWFEQFYRASFPVYPYLVPCFPFYVLFVLMYFARERRDREELARKSGTVAPGL